MGDYFHFLFVLLLGPRSPPSSHSPLINPLQLRTNKNNHRLRLTTSRTFSEEEVSLFARLCGDSNTLHQGRQSSFSSSSTSTSSSSSASSSSQVIVPGLLTASLFPGLVGTAVPGSVYLSQSLRFCSPLRSGERVDVEVSVLSKRVLPFSRVISSSGSSSSSSGLMMQALMKQQQNQQKQQQKQKKKSKESEQGGRGRERAGGETSTTSTTTTTATTTATPEENNVRALLPPSFVRAKLETRARKGDGVVVVEGEAEALWPVY